MSEGEITYRFMLGKDTDTDYDAQRNYHYKLTMKFNGYANDVDWHIDYDYVPKPPEIVVPTPMYISYLSNRSLEVPATVYYDNSLASVKSLRADIIENELGLSRPQVLRTGDEPVIEERISVARIQRAYERGPEQGLCGLQSVLRA